MITPTMKLACDLLERPSITPLDSGCQEMLGQRLQKLGFEITHFPVNEVKNLWAKRGKDQPTLCFAGHTDVVPPGDLNAWHSPPFNPTQRDTKLYARGAADMKSSIAAMVTACERFLAKNPDFPGSIAFLITSDEEGIAKDGTQAVLRELHARNEIPQWCLVGEASSTQRLGDTIKVGRRGSLTGYLKILGVQGHVAYPELAKNPIHSCFAPLAAIASTVWDQGQDPFPPTTLQFANIHAGTGASNVVPGILETNFNLRFSPVWTAQNLQNSIENILKEHHCQYEIRWHVGGKPFYTPPTSILIQKVSETINQIMGQQPTHSTSGGTSDGRFFAEYGCEVVEVGPINATIHQVNECIGIEELEQLSVLYEKILEKLFG